MSWEELNKDNIEEVKQYYYEYIEYNKENNYVANLKTFEEFIETELKRCPRCENIMEKDSEYCDCCHDELFEI